METIFDRTPLDRMATQWHTLVEGWMDTKYGDREEIRIMQYDRGDIMRMEPVALSEFVDVFWRMISGEGTPQSVQRFEHVLANSSIFLLVENYQVLLRDMYQYLWLYTEGDLTENVLEVSTVQEQVEQVVTDLYVSMASRGLGKPWWISVCSHQGIFWGEGRSEGDEQLTNEFWQGVGCLQSLGLEFLTVSEKEQIRAHMYALPTMAGERLGEYWDVLVQGMVLHPIYQKREAQRELANEQQWVQKAVYKVGH